jgi:crotonyl-CoA carboxylase/reductase
MIDLCELGERPPLGEVPPACTRISVRQNRFGQPRDAWRREVIPTPTLGPDEVLVYVMASGHQLQQRVGRPRHARST